MVEEMEQIAKRVVNGLSGPGWGNLDDVQRAKAVRTIEIAVSEAVAAEREACAKIAEGPQTALKTPLGDPCGDLRRLIANGIRNRA